MAEETESLTENTVPEIIVAPHERRSMGMMALSIIMGVLIADQMLKYWVKTNMFLGEEIFIVGKYFRFHFLENNGIAFGLQLGGMWGKIVLTLFRLALAGFILYLLNSFIKKGAKRGFIGAMALIFAGACGNIIDSVFYGVAFENINAYQGSWFQGRVVDMLYFPLVQTTFPTWMPNVGGQPFEFFAPVFNLADSAISTGVMIIAFFHRKGLQTS